MKDSALSTRNFYSCMMVNSHGKPENIETLSKAEVLQRSNSKFNKMVDSVEKLVMMLNQTCNRKSFDHPYMETVNSFYYDKLDTSTECDKLAIKLLDKEFKDIVSKVSQLQTQLRRDENAFVHKIQPHLHS